MVYSINGKGSIKTKEYPSPTCCSDLFEAFNGLLMTAYNDYLNIAIEIT